VSVIVDRWDEDWTRLAWLRVDGRAALIEPESRRRPASTRPSARSAHGTRSTPSTGSARPIIRIAVSARSNGRLGRGSERTLTPAVSDRLAKVAAISRRERGRRRARARASVAARGVQRRGLPGPPPDVSRSRLEAAAISSIAASNASALRAEGVR
jgi:hypothetical protein